MLMSYRSASSPNSWKIFSISPLSDPSLNRFYTVECGPYLSCRSRQAAPLRAIQKMPLNVSLGSRLGRSLSPTASQENRTSAAPALRLSVRSVEFFFICRAIFDVTPPLSFWFDMTNCLFLLFFRGLCVWKHALGYG